MSVDLKSARARDLDHVAFGPFVLIPNERRLLARGAPVKIGSRAMDLLIHFASCPGDVISHRELTARAWAGAQIEESNLRFQIGQLRRALADHADGAEYITSIPGRGYCFTAPPSLDAQAVEDVLPTRGAPLPAMTELVGRAVEIEGISRQLATGRLITIVGPGGVGKTTLATAIAHAFLRECIRTYYVDLAAVTDPQIVPGAVAAALRIPLHSADPVPALARLFSEQPVLLVLDNCEHVIEPATILVERILALAPETKIIATSREPLRAVDEMVCRLAPLAVPSEDGELEGILDCPAAQLFIRRARHHLGAFDVGENEAAVIAQICRKLDGIPLAIELAVGQLNALGLPGLAEVVTGEGTFEGRGRRTATTRQRTMQATIAWSYDLLSVDEARVLRALSVFSGSFTIQAAATVLQDVLPRRSELIGIVGSLVEKSLIVAEVDGARRSYRLLETTRNFANGKLRAAEDRGWSN